MAFDPTQFGATPVKSALPTNGSSFNPSSFGATPVKSNSSFPAQDPTHQSFMQRVTGAANSVGSFLGVSKLGQGLSTVGSPIAGQQADQSAQNTANVAKLLPIYHSTTDPVQKQHLANALKSMGTDVTGADVNPGLGLSNKEVLGSAANTALTIGTAGLGQPESLVGKSAAGAALGFGFDKANQANNNQKITATPGAGTAVGALLPFATKLIGVLGKSALGVTTGAGKDVIQRAVDNPDAVFNAIKSTTPETKQALVDTAKESLNSFIQNRNSQFGEGLSKMVASEPINKQTVIDSFAKQVSKFGGQVDNGAIKFGDTALNSTEQNAVKDVFNTIKTWKNVTPQGMETLRQRIGNEMSNFKFANNGRDSVVLGGVKQALTNDMKTKIPGYADLLKNYGNATDAAKALSKELSLGGTAKPSTQLSQVMKLFKKDPSVLANLNEVMGKTEANKFLNDVSGSILSDWLPGHAAGRGIGEATLAGAAHLGGAAISPPAVIAGLASQSPKIVGSGAALVGKGIQKGIGKGLTRAAILAASKK